MDVVKWVCVYEFIEKDLVDGYDMVVGYDG